MRQRAYVEILSTREVWRAWKRRKPELLEEQPRATLSLFRPVQTSRVLNISTYAQLKHELIVK